MNDETTAVALLGVGGAVGAGIAGHHKSHHNAAQDVVDREAEKYGWDDARRAHEHRALKRRTTLRAKVARKLRRS